MIVGERIPVGHRHDIQRMRIDDEWERAGSIHRLRPVVDIAALKRVTWRKRARQLQFPAGVIRRLNVWKSGDRQGVRSVGPLKAAGAEEPEAILHHWTAQCGLVGLLQLVEPTDLLHVLEWRFVGPCRIRIIGHGATVPG